MRTVYSERLWPAAWVWTWGALVAVTLGVVFIPATSLGFAAAVGVVALLGTFLLLRAWSPVVRVVEPEPGAGLWLQAGEARIPATALGVLEPLDPAGTKLALGPALDARAHLCIRGWVATGVRAEVVDTRDPVPYWLVSTRQPRRLAASLRTGSLQES